MNYYADLSCANLDIIFMESDIISMIKVLGFMSCILSMVGI
jgi:hypothetical protein